MEPTHIHRPVENATAPSAGGSPDPDGWSEYLIGRPLVCA